MIFHKRYDINLSFKLKSRNSERGLVLIILGFAKWKAALGYLKCCLVFS